MQFQFTPLREGLLTDKNGPLIMGIISIHAPARGASIMLFLIYCRMADFNSRPCERGFINN